MNSRYVLAELRRRPARTLAAALSLAVALALFISLQAYSSGYRQAARAPLAEIGTDVVAQRQGVRPAGFEGIVFPHSTAPIHRDEVEQIRDLAGVEAVSEAMFFWTFEGDRFVVALGIDPAPRVGPGRLRAGLRSGRFLQPGDRGVAVADDSYALQNGLAVGDRVDVADHAFEVVGLVDTSRAGQVANANVYLPIADVRPLVASAPNVRAVHDIRPDDANVVFIRAQASAGPAVARRVGEILGREALVTTPRSLAGVLGSTFSLIDRFGAAVGAAALVVAALALLRATAAGLVERRRDVGLLRAVGWARRNVMAQLTAEALATAALGIVAGLGLSVAVAGGLSLTEVTVPVPWELSPTPHFLPGGAKEVAMTVPLPARVTARVAGASVALGVALSGLVSLWMGRSSTAVKPAEVLRGE